MERFYLIGVCGVQFQVMLAEFPGALKFIVICVPQLLVGTMMVTCSLPPFGIVVLSAWTLTPLPSALADQVSAVVLD